MNNVIENIGVMIDCSRNAVYKIETLKSFAKKLSLLGYNSIQLYTEDTFKVDSEPYFGYLRGAYSESELKDFIEYCETLNIEVIPCIQTLAHLNCPLNLPVYDSIKDAGDALLVDEDKTYTFLDNLFCQVSKVFKSHRINIGFDEASMVGIGKHLKRFGFEERKTIMQRHLAKVASIADKYRLSPMMWSDMLFDIAEDGTQYVVRNDTGFTLPDNIKIIYWDYYHKDKEHYDKMCQVHKSLRDDVSFAGGAWTWTGFAPNNKYAIKTFKNALLACSENKINEAFLTFWGDDGAECPLNTIYPAVYYFSKIARNKKIDNNEFFSIFGIEIDDCFAFDDINYIGTIIDEPQNPSKYMLYNDLFLGKLDCTVEEDDHIEFSKMENKYLYLSKKYKDYSWLFDMYAKLCEVLKVKCDLGIKIRTAYNEKNKAKLKDCICDCKRIEKSLQNFKLCFERVWLNEKKPFGFEIQEVRLSGLIGRIDYCKRRLTEFVKGQILIIDELEEQTLEFDGSGKFNKGKKIVFNYYKDNITTGVL